jgi:hypothetical protein
VPVSSSGISGSGARAAGAEVVKAQNARSSAADADRKLRFDFLFMGRGPCFVVREEPDFAHNPLRTTGHGPRSTLHRTALINERIGKKIDKATVPTKPIKNNISAGSIMLKIFLMRRGMI